MSAIVPHSDGAIVPLDGTPSHHRVKAIPYEHAGPVGWERMPDRVRQQIAYEVDRLAQAASSGTAASGIPLVAPPVAGSKWPTTRRRPDGSCYQRGEGWWIGGAVLCEVEVRRDLAARPDGKLEPAGDWAVEQMAWFHLADVTTRVRRFVRSAGAGMGAGVPADVVRTHDPLEVIPTVASSLVRTGLRGSDCWLFGTGGGEATETVVAYAVAGDRLTALQATRTAPSVDQIELAAWSVRVAKAVLSPLEAATALPEGAHDPSR